MPTTRVETAMFSRAATLEMWCDAPDYAIVRACRQLGFRKPLDVAWYHHGRHLHSHRAKPGILAFFAWARCFVRSTLAPQCRCGAPLPALDLCAFTDVAGKELRYRLGQCCRC